ncbi:glutathione S-transferase family protein [Acidisoma cladoniae]|jgi:glutathione S-transferase|uniref:glutathione S-transferase family protein n=1 Tax=Acidisoma cladoniae TaxID=3040935 RepID=UPI002551B51A|nr:glutathione S-transferase family protein [Acidisoma sp. PAMC 29798]
MSKIILWGFSHSTYVRTIRMLLAEKGVQDYEQVPLNVLEGEPKTPEHLERHPFGKVPVVDIDGFRIIETPAIARYLNTVLPGPSLVPSEPKDVARMDMVLSIIDSYGYGALLGGVVAYHLFPDFVGGKNEAAHHKGLEDGKLTVSTLMGIKGDASYLAGDHVSLADFYLAPIMAYVMLTPHKDEFLALPGVSAWWSLVSGLGSFHTTDP